MMITPPPTQSPHPHPAPGETYQGVSHATRLPGHVARRQADGARKILGDEGYDIDIRVEVNQDALGPGSGIVLWSEGQGRVGEVPWGKGVKSREGGEEAARELLFHLERDAPLDSHLSDQIIPYLALAGDSRVKVAQIPTP